MTEKIKLLITPDVKIYELLDSYPELEDVLIEISPLFIKLKNPVLRRTIARVTTLKQASVVGKVSLNDMINRLRKAAGQVQVEIIADKILQKEKPGWANNENIKTEYDAREDLDNGIQPLNKVLRETKDLHPGEKYLLITAFVPAPIIELQQNNGFECYSDVISDSEVKNYFMKK
jgi:hypothetical protein